MQVKLALGDRGGGLQYTHAVEVLLELKGKYKVGLVSSANIVIQLGVQSGRGCLFCDSRQGEAYSTQTHTLGWFYLGLKARKSGVGFQIKYRETLVTGYKGGGLQYTCNGMVLVELKGKYQCGTFPQQIQLVVQSRSVFELQYKQYKVLRCSGTHMELKGMY